MHKSFGMDRRGFLVSAGAAALTCGCTGGRLFGCRRLAFGVVSDIHVTTRASAVPFRNALGYFRRRGVDAVMVPGDLTDWGLRSSLDYVKDAWDDVFAESGVVPLFCTGNHEYHGWHYSDMSVEMKANGYSGDEALAKLGMKEQWENVFGKRFAEVRLRSVRGFDFVSCEWNAENALVDWLRSHGGRLRGDRPFFLFRHAPIPHTTSDSCLEQTGGELKQVLSGFANCIAFTGHTHRPFLDERSIWYGDFTAVSTPSLSYACWPEDHENGEGDRLGNSRQAMPMIPARRDLRGGQGYFVEVFDDEVRIERVDLEEEMSDTSDWIVPLLGGLHKNRMQESARAASEPVPVFPQGAELRLSTRNTENRVGHWAIVLCCEFPSATMPVGRRVFDYEVRVTVEDGGVPVVKRFLSPAYAKMSRYEPDSQMFWFDVKELPQGRRCRVEVFARNSYGGCSSPLVSRFPM